MDLRTNSLLYKYLGFHNKAYDLRHDKVTLCSLFWMTLFLLLRDLVILAAFLIIVCIPAPFFLDWFGAIPTMKGMLYTTPWYWLASMPFVGAVFWGIVALSLWSISVFWTRVEEWSEDKRNSRKFAKALKMEMARDEELKFSNMWQKMKIAKEEKFCPIIRVVDE